MRRFAIPASIAKTDNQVHHRSHADHRDNRGQHRTDHAQPHPGHDQQRLRGEQRQLHDGDAQHHPPQAAETDQQHDGQQDRRGPAQAPAVLLDIAKTVDDHHGLACDRAASQPLDLVPQLADGFLARHALRFLRLQHADHGRRAAVRAMRVPLEQFAEPPSQTALGIHNSVFRRIRRAHQAGGHRDLVQHRVDFRQAEHVADAGRRFQLPADLPQPLDAAAVLGQQLRIRVYRQDDLVASKYVLQL